jgi:hypothetical protein
LGSIKQQSEKIRDARLKNFFATVVAAIVISLIDPMFHQTDSMYFLGILISLPFLLFWCWTFLGGLCRVAQCATRQCSVGGALFARYLYVAIVATTYRIHLLPVSIAGVKPNQLGHYVTKSTVRMLTLILSCGILVNGCTAHVYEDARVSEPVSDYKVDCDKPYDITRDCAFDNGPARKASINEVHFNFGGNDSGDTLWVSGTYSGQVGRNFKDLATLNTSDSHGDHLELVLDEIEQTLAANNVQIKKIIPIVYPDFFLHVGTVGANTASYFLELDRDGYSVLEVYALEPANNSANQQAK